MQEQFEAAPSGNCFTRFGYGLASSLYSGASTVYGAVSSASSRVNQFLDDHEDGLTTYTTVYESLAEIVTNTFTFSLVFGAFMYDESWLGFPLKTLYGTVPLSLFTAVCASIVHRYTNDNHKSTAGEHHNPPPFTRPKKLLVGVLLAGDLGDHTGAFAASGILFVRFLAGDRLSPAATISIYLSILACSGIASVSEVRTCAGNMLAYYRNEVIKKQEEAKPDFFTWFTIGFGGVMTLVNSYTIFGLTLDSMTEATPVALGLSTSGLISCFIFGSVSAFGSIVAHAAVPIAYQAGRQGYLVLSDDYFNRLGKFVNAIVKWGDRGSHAGNYASSLVQIRTQFLPRELVTLAGALGLDLTLIMTAIIGIIAETRICANETTGFLMKFGMFKLNPMQLRAHDDEETGLVQLPRLEDQPRSRVLRSGYSALE